MDDPSSYSQSPTGPATFGRPMLAFARSAPGRMSRYARFTSFPQVGAGFVSLTEVPGARVRGAGDVAFEAMSRTRRKGKW